jgi:DHA1 family multidrug resistance protein-like MFS transporter
LQDRAFVLYTALMMGYWFMWVQLSIALPLKAVTLSGSNSSVAILFTVNAVIAVVLQVPVLRLAQRFLLPLPMLIVGILLMAVGLGSVAWASTSWQLYQSIFFFALGTVLVMPNAQTVAATMANPAARGAYFGVNSLALAIGGGIGQIAGGTAVDLANTLNIPALPWMISAAAGLIAAAGLLHFYSHNRCRVTPRGLLGDCGD